MWGRVHDDLDLWGTRGANPEVARCTGCAQERDAARKLAVEATAAREVARRKADEELVRDFLVHMRDQRNPGTVRLPYADGLHLRLHQRPKRRDHRVTGWLLGTATITDRERGEECGVSRNLLITTDGQLLKAVAGTKAAWATTLGLGSNWSVDDLAERLARLERLARESHRD